jgi:hypothetical protein
MVASRTETFLVSDIGNCLMLKLCGFVEECRAEIRDVSENHLRLRLGGSWFQQLLGDGTLGHPLELEILFVPVESETATRPLARLRNHLMVV